MRFTAILLALPMLAMSQLHPYTWRIGFNTGFSTYYGDLTPYRLNAATATKAIAHVFTYNAEYVPLPSWQLSLERYISSSWALKMAVGSVSFSANDRFVKPDGTLWTDAPFFDRGLNAETSIYDASIGFLFKTDNLKWLSHRSFLAPFVGLHAVLLNFETYGDLRDDEGNFYNLANTSLRQNGVYETLLTGLKTEGIDYPTLAFGARFELGVRIRLSRQLNLTLATQLTVTTTDYLDDVSLDYPTQFSSQLQQRASDPTNRRQTTSKRGDDLLTDSYLFHSIGIQYSFGSRKKFNKFPVIGGFAPPPAFENKSSKFDPAVAASAKSSAPILSDSAVYLFQNQQFQINDLRTALNKALLEINILKSQQKLGELHNQTRATESKLISLNDTIHTLKVNLNEIHSDTILPENVRDSAIVEWTNKLKQLEQKRDSLQTYLKTLHTQKDSINAWIISQETFLENWPAFEGSEADAFTQTEPRKSKENHHSNSRELQVEKKPAPEIPPSYDSTTTSSAIELQPSDIDLPNETKVIQREPVEKASSVSSYNQPKSAVATTQRSTKTQRGLNEGSNTIIQRSRSGESPGTPIDKPTEFADPANDTTERITIVKILENQTKILDLLTQQIQFLQKEKDAERSAKSERERSIKSDQVSEDLNDTTVAILENLSQGLPVLTLPVTAGFKTRTTIYFASGKNNLPASEESHVREIARYLADSTTSSILLRGYADNTGPQSLNFKLIEQRLNYVKNLLVEEGVHPGRIRIEKGGIIVKPARKAQPRDRRVEILLQAIDR